VTVVLTSEMIYAMLSVVSIQIFSNRLKALRETCQLSQRKLSKALGFGTAAVYYYETGKRTPDIEVLKKIAGYFDVSADYLIGLTDDPYGGISEQLKNEIEENKRIKQALNQLKGSIDAIYRVINHSDE